jgi:hypothetical protein
MKGISELGTTFAVIHVTANVVPSWLILSILMMEAIISSETSVLTRTTRRHIPEDGIVHINVVMQPGGASRDTFCVTGKTIPEGILRRQNPFELDVATPRHRH